MRLNGISHHSVTVDCSSKFHVVRNAVVKVLTGVQVIDSKCINEEVIECLNDCLGGNH